MHTGLFFGSFNPVHIGHLAIANYMLEFTDMEQLWFVVSPHNPFKHRHSLLPERDRLHLVNLAIEPYPQYKASDIEFKMPKPSYTIDTLVRLSEKYPQHRFSLIMGSDNLESFRKWKNHEAIVAQYHRYIYPRPDSSGKPENIENATVAGAPQMNISSSFIRSSIAQGKDLPFFMPEKVYQYIREMHFYLPSPSEIG
ncbi:MAG: nicotinate-nucleotide adenylyltransferase [Bacteroidales bacterium]|jgi:nicotinate-nucleotide adenylyltransferase|nr:nicotinate-nucleotide adenylyltransferase [Bacteroidales bacterium]